MYKRQSPEIRSQVLTTARPVLGPQHSPFLEKVSPRIIIRTAGPPGPSLLPGTSDWPAVGAISAPTLWTDRDGAVTAEMKENSLRVSTFRGGVYIIP